MGINFHEYFKEHKCKEEKGTKSTHQLLPKDALA
jgi:hypothetical protein